MPGAFRGRPAPTRSWAKRLYEERSTARIIGTVYPVTRDLLVGLAGALRDHDGSGLQPLRDPAARRAAIRGGALRGSDL
jgi:hypothetical protein